MPPGWQERLRWITIEGKSEPPESETLNSLISCCFQETGVRGEGSYVLIRRKINHRLFSSKGVSC